MAGWDPRGTHVDNAQAVAHNAIDQVQDVAHKGDRRGLASERQQHQHGRQHERQHEAGQHQHGHERQPRGQHELEQARQQELLSSSL